MFKVNWGCFINMDLPLPLIRFVFSFAHESRSMFFEKVEKTTRPWSCHSSCTECLHVEPDRSRDFRTLPAFLRTLEWINGRKLQEIESEEERMKMVDSTLAKPFAKLREFLWNSNWQKIAAGIAILQPLLKTLIATKYDS